MNGVELHAFCPFYMNRGDIAWDFFHDGSYQILCVFQLFKKLSGELDAFLKNIVSSVSVEICILCVI